jgi:hypothetical protein
MWEFCIHLGARETKTSKVVLQDTEKSAVTAKVKGITVFTSENTLQNCGNRNL